MMRTTVFNAILGTIAAAGILAGCGGSQSTLTPAAGMNAVQALGLRGSAGVTRDLARHEKIGYIANFYRGTVLEFKYPKGEPLAGTISAVVAGFCSRTSTGTFWATVPGAVEEFKVGGSTPIKTLHLTTTGESGPCSIDKGSGDLAVLTVNGVVIFKHAAGSGKEIATGLTESYYVGYDGNGDLFVDGFTSHLAVGLNELPAGGSSFHAVTVSNTIEFPGTVQWDGTYITVEDQEGEAIYGYTVSDYVATLERTVDYSGASDCAAGYIYKGRGYLCLDAGDENVKVYGYPAGGAPLHTWGSSASGAAGIVVEK